MSTDNKNYDFVIESGYEELDPNSPVIGYEKRGRCTKCWGQLWGRKDEDEKWNFIGCRLCGVYVEGDVAESERKRMEYEAEENLNRIRQLSIAKYEKKSRFVYKILPDMMRDRPYYGRQIATKRALKLTETQKRKWLTRHDICKGAAGYFYLQACTLMAGTKDLPRVESVVPYSDFDFNELNFSTDGKLARYSTQTNSKVSWESDKLVSNMGTLMILGMSAAFSCELALKAILITRNNETKKTHDLLDLYKMLPADCRSRIEADFAETEDVIAQGRHVFGKWRYFELNEGEKSMLAMVDIKRTYELAKVARVLIDDGVIAGLNYKIDVNHEFEIDLNDPDVSLSQTYKLGISGEESAINWQKLLDWNGKTT
ncbi:MAG: HEPN domain-containing protein [Gemmatimonadota bacterium]|nr:HEPN domain-containing protein [Gemmatimonadota bacterium]